jgi:hypothetical protein
MHGFWNRGDRRERRAAASRAPRARELGRALVLLGIGGSSLGGFVAALTLATRALGR